MLKFAQAAFAVTYFWGLLDVHECLGGGVYSMEWNGMEVVLNVER